MTALESMLAQYEKNTAPATTKPKVSDEDRLKKYFTTALPKGVKSKELRIRILPTKDGSSPFVEKNFHEVQVNTWDFDKKDYKKQPLKLYDPLQDKERSPLDEVKKGLYASGTEEDKELAKDYIAKKFYIIKVIDRDNEQDGPKFWRFKHNSKGEGIYDKIFPIIRNKGDITAIEDGRDLVLSVTLTKSGNGKEYSTINSIIPEDKSPLHTDPLVAQSWVDEPSTWVDVYPKKSLDYLEIVAKGQTPKWDRELNKFVSDEESKKEEETTIAQPPVQSSLLDPQESEAPSDELPF